MGGTTPTWAIPYPTPDEPVAQGAANMKAMADRLEVIAQSLSDLLGLKAGWGMNMGDVYINQAPNDREICAITGLATGNYICLGWSLITIQNTPGNSFGFAKDGTKFFNAAPQAGMRMVMTPTYITAGQRLQLWGNDGSTNGQSDWGTHFQYSQLVALQVHQQIGTGAPSLLRQLVAEALTGEVVMPLPEFPAEPAPKA